MESTATRDIYLTGNIASGKPTLAKLLAEQVPGACFVPEPYERNPFLALYLLDQPRWAFTSTLRYYLDYVQVLVEQKAAHPDCHTFFIDAGSWTNALLYARYAAGEKMMTAEEYAFYQEMRAVVDTAYPQPMPAGFIFVHTDPKVCLKRMRARGWDFQKNTVDLPYLLQLEKYLARMKTTLQEMGIKAIELSSQDIPFHQPGGIEQAHAAVACLL